MRLKQTELPKNYVGVAVTFTDADAEEPTDPDVCVADAAITVHRESWYRASVNVALSSTADPSYRKYQIEEVMQWMDQHFSGTCRCFEYGNVTKFVKVAMLSRAERRSKTLSEYRLYNVPRDVLKRYDALGAAEISPEALALYNGIRRAKRQKAKKQAMPKEPEQK